MLAEGIKALYRCSFGNAPGPRSQVVIYIEVTPITGTPSGRPYGARIRIPNRANKELVNSRPAGGIQFPVLRRKCEKNLVDLSLSFESIDSFLIRKHLLDGSSNFINPARVS